MVVYCHRQPLQNYLQTNQNWVLLLRDKLDWLNSERRKSVIFAQPISYPLTPSFFIEVWIDFIGKFARLRGHRISFFRTVYRLKAYDLSFISVVKLSSSLLCRLASMPSLWYLSHISKAASKFKFIRWIPKQELLKNLYPSTHNGPRKIFTEFHRHFQQSKSPHDTHWSGHQEKKIKLSAECTSLVFRGNLLPAGYN